MSIVLITTRERKSWVQLLLILTANYLLLTEDFIFLFKLDILDKPVNEEPKLSFTSSVVNGKTTLPDDTSDLSKACSGKWSLYRVSQLYACVNLSLNPYFLLRQNSKLGRVWGQAENCLRNDCLNRTC